MSGPLTSHVLETGKGVAAVGLKATLFKLIDNNKQEWKEIAKKETNTDGRLLNMLTNDDFHVGIYKFRFDVSSYYNSIGVSCFYPWIDVVFEVKDTKRHYHVPILLSPFGYTTYRGT